MKILKKMSLLYSTILCLACYVYYDTVFWRVLLVGVVILCINFGLYKIYDSLMESKKNVWKLFAAYVVGIILMNVFIDMGTMFYELPYWIWMLTPQSALDYTPYFTFAMLPLIIMYMSGLAYYSTLNRYMLFVNFLITILPFAIFARDDTFMPMWLAIPVVIMFFIMFIACRQVLLVPILPKEYKRYPFKVKYKEKHKLELRIVRENFQPVKFKIISFFVVVMFSVCLLIPRPSYTAKRDFFDALINAAQLVNYLSSRFDIFTEVADPDVYRNQSNTNYELFKVYSDEPLRLKAMSYDTYDWDTGSWERTVKATEMVEENSNFQSKEATIKYSRYRGTALVPTKTYNIAFAQTGSGYDFSYYPDSNVYNPNILKKINSTTTDDIIENITNDELKDYATAYGDYLTYDIPENIYNLSAEITENCVTNFDKVKAIENYFFTNGYIYDLEYESTDINDFLFVNKTGVCYEYATAMVLLTRAAGIPARFATGYAAYDYDPENKCYIVTQNSAHAFPEVFIRGYGWMSFEPTITIQANSNVTEQQQTKTKQAISYTSIAFLGLVVLFFGFYFFILPIVKERKFRKKVLSSNRELSYSLVFNKLRDLFKLPKSATLDEVINIGNLYLPLDKKIITAIIYNNKTTQKDILEDYKLIKKLYSKSQKQKR